MSTRCEFACAARGCDGCTLCQPEKWLKHYQTENARLREVLQKIAVGGVDYGKLATAEERMIVMAELAHIALEEK